MARVLIAHGIGTTDDSVWFPAAGAALEARGHQVDVAELPNTDMPEVTAWLAALTESAAAHPAAETVLVGHSLGGATILRMLSEHDPDRLGQFAGVVLVSTAAHDVGWPGVSEFFAEPFDLPRISRTARRFRVVAAIDDPVNQPDPVEHVKLLVQGLGATAVLTPSGGHLGAAPDDHIDLPEVVGLVLDCLAQVPEPIR